MRTSPIGEHVCFNLLEPKPPSGGADKKMQLLGLLFRSSGRVLCKSSFQRRRVTCKWAWLIYVEIKSSLTRRRGDNKLLEIIPDAMIDARFLSKKKYRITILLVLVLFYGYGELKLDLA